MYFFVWRVQVIIWQAKTEQDRFDPQMLLHVYDYRYAAASLLNTGLLPQVAPSPGSSPPPRDLAIGDRGKTASMFDQLPPHRWWCMRFQVLRHLLAHFFRVLVWHQSHRYFAIALAGSTVFCPSPVNPDRNPLTSRVGLPHTRSITV